MSGRAGAEGAVVGSPRPAEGGLPGREAVEAGLRRARDHLLSLQDPAGFFKGILDTNVTMDAEDLLLREVLGISDPAVTEPTARWIRANQLEDGSWPTFHGGPGDLSTTVEAYLALRLAGDDPAAPHMRKAAAFVRAHGGVPATRVFTRIWLALVGLWPWSALPPLPPEVVLLPPSVPLNVFDFACWARQTIVPLTVVAAHRLVRPVAVDLSELRPEGRGILRPRRAPGPKAARPGAGMRLLDAALRAYERRPVPFLRKAALAQAELFILRRQEADGSFGGIQPPWVYSLLALHVLGYRLDHPAMRAGLEGLERFTVLEGDTRRLEACQSPVWDTALAVIALRDAGLPVGHPALERAVRFLRSKEVTTVGDWAVRRPELAPSGFSFEFHNVHYPDVDDTAEVVLALLAAGGSPDDPLVRRAVRWVKGMQSRNGGFGAFDADNDRELVRRLPFCDFGEVIDPPSADVTAHALEMLAACGEASGPSAERALRYLWGEQEPDGAFFGRWGANYLYGTGAALPALVACGVDPADERLARARRFLVEHQHPSGGFGEDLRSYTDPSYRGRGEPTASQTAWALLGLLALERAGAADRESRLAADRAVAYLVRAQRPDGTWDEPYYTGTGFPGDFFINYHLYRLVFPVMALGRYLRCRAEGEAPGGPLRAEAARAGLGGEALGSSLGGEASGRGAG
jgi:squalene-hopene/tetraprenyl-beta-curcumene cyclase